MQTDSKELRLRCVCNPEPCLGLQLSRSQLGGKDPAYVRSDADLDYTVAELVDGACEGS